MEGKTVHRTCLIVDDEPAIRAYIKAVLRKEQYEALEAENAAQAFELVKRLDGGLHLIVSDIDMPGDIDGLDLAYAVQNAFPTIPVVLVSDSADTELARNFAFLRKPFSPTAIVGAVNKATAIAA
jgi:DNA-binding NtrC family response regulator